MPGDQITRLDPATVERIAAGEVVERPASVVKELVENSIDAGASRVAVAVAAGGTASIRVRDDGDGMSRAQAERAVEKHTTSKISDIGDLEAGVGTLGFRGEALHAIGAVSRLTLTTRPHDAETGTAVTVEGGEVTDVSPAGCPPGTTVEVTDLFYNVPARRKYLKQEATEFAHVNTVVTSYALANPDVAVSLEHDDRETFATTGSDDRREAVMAVYGREVAQAMVPVDPGELPEGPLDGVTGLVSHPETNRASRDYLSTFVNGRYVTASQVREAVVDAYGTQLAPDRYPFAVLDLALDPAAVDVNVHPRKLEVRFADEAAVQTQVEAAVNAALMREGLVRSRAARGRSAADETPVSPHSPEEPGPDGPADGWNGAGDAEGAGAGAADAGGAGAEPSSNERSGAEPVGDSSAPDGQPGTGPSADSSRAAESQSIQSGTQAGDDAGTPDTASGRERPGGRRIRPGHEQRRLGDEGDDADAGAPGETASFDALPAMRILGQLQDTYIVAETAEGLVLVDQHAADERINYESLRDALDGDVTTQALAEPVTLELTAREAELFDAHRAALARLGFQASREDDRTVTVTTVPDLVAEAAEPSLLRDVIDDLVGGEAAAAATVDAAADDLLGDLACYPAITGNTSLTEGSAVDLLRRLDECENPWACPHGRPVVIEIDGDEIADRFERDYPGHR